MKSSRIKGNERKMTELEQKEAAVQELNRSLTALKNSSQVMIRATSEVDCLAGICKVIVEDCGYLMVWVGFAEEDARKRVYPVASLGFKDGYLKSLQVTYGDDERGHGPTGTAIRTGQVVVWRNLLTDSCYERWKEEAVAQGYASVAALPLQANSQIFGAISIYSKHADPFGEQELKLLKQLADDVSYCIGALRVRRAHARAEEALRQSEERYRGLVELSPDAIFVIRHNRFVFVNTATLRLFGAKHGDELLGRSPLDFIHPKFRDLVRQRLELILRGESQPLVEEKIVRLDGATLDVEVVASPMMERGGRAILAVMRNITARKRAEARTDLLAETASQLLKTDTPQHIVDRLCQRVLDFLDCQFFFNFLVDEGQQRLHLNVYAGISVEEARNIEWLDFGVAVCGAVARDRTPIVVENIQETPDPRTALVAAYGIQAYACHPLMVQGRVLGTLSFGARNRSRFTEEELSLMKAVTDQVAIAMERQRAQEALRKVNEQLEQRVVERTAEVRESEARYRSLVTASSQIVWITDPRGEITQELPAWEAFTGQSVEEYRGSGWTAVVHPDDRERAKQSWYQAVTTRKPYEIEYRIRRWDRVYRHVFVRGVPVKDADGSVREWVGTCTDISEQKDAARRRDFTTALLALFAEKSTIAEYLDSVVEETRRFAGCEALGVRLVTNGQIPFQAW
ncbi:MAG TPA: PAS domain S-box protein, partial [Clostridia bacterium]|nr:PAS domain S-box protein [Clostridia bacterium]